MTRFTIEETNLISIYNTGTRGAVTEEIAAALPYMDEYMTILARRVMGKLDTLTDDEYARLALDPADERDG